MNFRCLSGLPPSSTLPVSDRRTSSPLHRIEELLYRTLRGAGPSTEIVKIRGPAGLRMAFGAPRPRATHLGRRLTPRDGPMTRRVLRSDFGHLGGAAPETGGTRAEEPPTSRNPIGFSARSRVRLPPRRAKEEAANPILPPSSLRNSVENPPPGLYSLARSFRQNLCKTADFPFSHTVL